MDFGKILIMVLANVAIVLVANLIGYQQGWKAGKKYRPSEKNLQELTGEEIIELGRAVVSELVRRNKATIQLRLKLSEKLGNEIATPAARNDIMGQGRNDKQEETKVFEEFEEDKTCKH